MKRRSLIAAGVALMLATVTVQAETFKVGLLTQGSATESGWNRIAYNAIQTIGKELGAEISNVELDSNPASFEKAFRDYAARGFKMVIGHGFQFQDAALEVAEDYPDTAFLISSSVVYEGNVVGVNLSPQEPFFLIGALAAMRGNKAGYIGGVEIPPIKFAAEGFKNGALYINPDFEVQVVMTGSWSDLALTKEAALSMIASGADFIVPNANVSAMGAFQAVAEAGKGLSAFGAFGNYTENAPGKILGNYTPDLARGYVSIAAEIRDGTFDPGSNIIFGLADETVVKFEFNEDAANPITEEEMAKLEEISAKIISGEIDPQSAN